MMRPYWPHENDPSILDGSLDAARNADELMSGIVARRLVEHLERSGFVDVGHGRRHSARARATTCACQSSSWLILLGREYNLPPANTEKSLPYSKLTL
jgi:hypothetical protein